jgi:hypothetical protein
MEKTETENVMLTVKACEQKDRACEQGSAFIVMVSCKSERIKLSLYLVLVFLVTITAVMAIHEAGHAIADILIGNKVYCIHISPFFGQVLAIYHGKPSISQGLHHLSGIILTQLVGIGLCLFAKSKRTTQSLYRESLLVMFIVGCFSDIVYLIMSVLFRFGDGNEAVKHFHISWLWMLLAGLLLIIFDVRLLRVPLRKWCDTFCPAVSRKIYAEILFFCAIFLACMAFPYYFYFAYNVYLNNSW